MKKTRVIAIEGIDGSGKSVQFQLLAQACKDRGLRVEQREYPVYHSYFGGAVGQLLSGQAGVQADQVDGKSMALWFALDRWEAMQAFDPEAYDVVLINRYVLSNAVYQSIRDLDLNSNTDMLAFCTELEYGHFHLPRPDMQLILDVAPMEASRNVEKKGFRDYVGDKKDVYEAAGSLQQRARDRYLQYAARLDDAFVISCMEAGRLLPEEQVHEKIMAVVLPRLNLC